MPANQGLLHNALTFFFWWCFFGALVWWARESLGMTKAVYRSRVAAGKPVGIFTFCKGTLYAILLWPLMLFWFWTHRKTAFPALARNLWGRP